MTHEERQELNSLSKQVFGTSSRWAKIVKNGIVEPMEREREVLVPTNRGIEKKIFKDKKNVIKRYTIEETKKLMLDILEARKQDLARVGSSPDLGAAQMIASSAPLNNQS